VLMQGGVDINNPKVADDYAQLAYCNLYQKNFKNDVEWNKIRAQISARVQEKKEYFRVLYETSSAFKLGRYNMETQSFPLTPKTAMVNVGSIMLTELEDYTRYCGIMKPSSFFPPAINLLLNQPLTVKEVKIPMDRVEKMLARMDETGNTDRKVYGRIRFRIIGAPGPVISNDQAVRSDVLGEIMSIDFFLDSELTKPVGKAQWK